MFRSIAFLSLCLVSVTAHAAGRPMIEVGAGAVGSGSGDMSVLLKVAAHGTTLEAGDEFAGILLEKGLTRVADAGAGIKDDAVAAHRHLDAARVASEGNMTRRRACNATPNPPKLDLKAHLPCVC